MIAARQIAFGKAAGAKGPTAKDYIQDGLVAMWDGIENAGWGVHDPNATVWKDLSGSGHSLSSPDFKWIENALDDSAYNIRLDAGDLQCTTGITMESVINCPNYRNNAYIFCFDDGVGGCAMYTTNLGSPFGVRCSFRNQGLVYSVAQNCDSNLSMQLSSIWQDDTAKIYSFGKEYTVHTIPRKEYLAASAYWILGHRVNTGNNFRGFVHCLRVYNRALTAEEIAHNYSIDKVRFGL